MNAVATGLAAPPHYLVCRALELGGLCIHRGPDPAPPRAGFCGSILCCPPPGAARLCSQIRVRPGSASCKPSRAPVWAQTPRRQQGPGARPAPPQLQPIWKHHPRASLGSPIRKHLGPGGQDFAPCVYPGLQLCLGTQARVDTGDSPRVSRKTPRAGQPCLRGRCPWRPRGT